MCLALVLSSSARHSTFSNRKDQQRQKRSAVEKIDDWQVNFDDGGIGILIDGNIYLGYDQTDILRLLKAVFPSSKIADGDLIEATKPYISGDNAFNDHIATLADAANDLD